MDRKREDLLERVKGKKYQWETRSMCRTLLVGMMDKAVESSDEKHCSDMVSGMVDEAWIELCKRRIVEEIWEGEDSICREVEKRLYERREEELFMIMMLAMEWPRGRQTQKNLLAKVLTTNLLVNSPGWGSHLLHHLSNNSSPDPCLPL